jgi:hypothetical protein
MVVLFTGCGILHPPHKVDGYYISHYISCGPEAIQDAIEHYYRENEEYRILRHLSRKDISQDIQDTDSFVDGRKCMTLVHRDFAGITWPHEVKEICESYGFTVTKLDSLDDFRIGQTGIVLIHQKSSLVYHWVCYPADDVAGFYGEDQTIILDIFLLTR